MKLEDAIELSKQYEVKNIYDILVESRKIMDIVKNDYPMRSQEFYEGIVYRRIKFKCKAGYFKNNIEWK